MSATIKAADIYVGTDRSRRAFVLGWQFGPVMLATSCSIEDALDEFDERHGERVDVSDPALADYDGDTTEERIESAMAHGDIRINDGGTMVWVDPYEWVREFRTVREAGWFFRGVADAVVAQDPRA